MADQTIITEFVVQASQAIDDAMRFDQVVQRIKNDLKALASESQTSFRSLGESFKNEIKNLKFDTEGIKKLGDMLKTDLTGASSKEFAAAQTQAINLVTRAVTESNAEQRRQAQQTSKEVTSAKQQEAAAAREYERVTRQGYGVMTQAATAYAQQVQKIKQDIMSLSAQKGISFQAAASQLVQGGESIRATNSALKELQTTSTQTQSSVFGLGDAIKYAFVTIMGLNAVNAIRQLMAEMSKLLEMGEELGQSYFRLEAATRSLRRVGLDITSKEILDNFQRINEETGNFYTQLELVKGAADLTNLIRNMRFTKEQVLELSEVITKLSIRSGRSIDDVSRTVALFLSSGYTEGVQRLGVSINKVTIQNEANRMGFEGTIQTLEEWQKAQAGLSLLNQDAALSADDYSEAQNRLFGSLVQTRTEIENTKAALGEQLLPVQLGLLKVAQLLVKVIGSIPFIYAIRSITTLIQAFRSFGDVAEEAVRRFNTAGERIKFVLDYFLALAQAFRDMESLGEVISEFTGFGQTEVEVGVARSLQEEAESAEESALDIMEIIDDLHDDIEKETRRFNNRISEMARDLARDLQKIQREMARDIARIWRDYENDIARIREDGVRKATEAIKKYGRDVQSTNQKAANQRAEAEAKYREQELQAEIEYQERLKRLREGFLFDLEDALRERDARQVLNLIRRYNLEKDQTKRQYAIDSEERKRQFNLRMQEIERERQERLRQLAQELADRLAAIRAETAMELEERRRKAEEDEADRRLKAEQDKQERLIRHQEQMTELKIQFAERIAEIFQALAAEHNLTASMLNAIGNEYKRVYGRNGVVEQQIKYVIGLLNAFNTSMANAGKNLPTGANNAPKTQRPGTKQSGTMRAEGGIMYADRPTTVTFGEAGLEKAEFTPLSFAGKNVGQVDTNRVFGQGNGMGGEVAIRILLSPELIGEIQENTLNNVANIMFEVQRSKR